MCGVALRSRHELFTCLWLEFVVQCGRVKQKNPPIVLKPSSRDGSIKIVCTDDGFVVDVENEEITKNLADNLDKASKIISELLKIG